MDYETAIIIPAYNVEKYIEKCINSCLEQTSYENYCIVVVDDFSVDKTLENIPEDDTICKIINNRNFGATKSRNIGAKYAIENYGCKYLHFFDADDIACDNMLSEKIKIIKDKDVSVVYSGYYNMTDSGEIIGSENKPIFNYHRLIEDNYISMVSMIKSNVFQEIGGLNELLTYCEDWDLYLRAIEKGIAVCVDKPLFKYRSNPDSQTRNNIDWNIYSLDKNIVIKSLAVRRKQCQINELIEAQNNKILYIERKKCQI